MMHLLGTWLRPRRGAARGLLVVLLLALLGTGCDDESEEPAAYRACGNGVCEPERCETMVRCADDCGACVGTGCNPTAVTGTCGEPCASSCDCLPQAEVCTADFGFAAGQCVPLDCLECIETCQYSPDASGVCATPSCP
jgi:hypothetical protein